MSEKKAYPLRINAVVLDAVQRWADDELRSLNAQIEYVLREALRKMTAAPASPAASPPGAAPAPATAKGGQEKLDDLFK